MKHSLSEFLRRDGSAQYVFARQNRAVYGYRPSISIKSLFPGYADLRANFTDQPDRVIADNTRMLLNALTPSDTVPWVTEADLRDVSDAKEEALRQWDARLTAIFEEYQTHPQRLRPLRAAMEERLLRAFAGLINQLRQQDRGSSGTSGSRAMMTGFATATPPITINGSAGTIRQMTDIRVRRIIVAVWRNRLFPEGRMMLFLSTIFPPKRAIPFRIC